MRYRLSQRYQSEQQQNFVKSDVELGFQQQKRKDLIHCSRHFLLKRERKEMKLMNRKDSILGMLERKKLGLPGVLSRTDLKFYTRTAPLHKCSITPTLQWASSDCVFHDHLLLQNSFLVWSPRAHLHMVGMLRLMSLTSTNRAFPLLFILFLSLFLSL